METLYKSWNYYNSTINKCFSINTYVYISQRLNDRFWNSLFGKLSEVIWKLLESGAIPKGRSKQEPLMHDYFWFMLCFKKSTIVWCMIVLQGPRQSFLYLFSMYAWTLNPLLLTHFYTLLTPSTALVHQQRVR